MAKETTGFIYMNIYNDLKETIESKTLKPGERLPTESELTESYSASRDTVRKALGKLENEGYISRRAATGTVVRYKKADYALARMESFTEQMLSRGMTPSSEMHIIELAPEPSAEVMEELRLGERDKIYKVARLRKADGTPMAYEIAYISQALCPNLHLYLTDDASLYNLYENKFGLHMKYGRVALEAELPSQHLQKVLEIKQNVAVLKMRCTVMLEDETPLYHVICYYVGDKYMFTADLPR